MRLLIFVWHRIPGTLNDRRTMLGELNWVFTAITDTIAWNILPRGTIKVINSVMYDYFKTLLF